MENFHETGLPIHGSFSSTSNHLHPLQVENCDSNTRFVVDEDDNGKFRLQRGKGHRRIYARHGIFCVKFLDLNK